MSGEKIDIIRELLARRRTLNGWMRYLAAYKIIEGNLALFDKLARCRSLREFQDALYEASRVKEKVQNKMKEGLSQRKIGLAEGLSVDDFIIGEGELREIMELATTNPEAPRMIGSLIASFGLVYGGVWKEE